MKKIIFPFVLLISITILSINSFSQTNYTLNGNLGVGTTPTHKLSVAGDSKMEGELTVTEKTKLENEVEIAGNLKLSSLVPAPILGNRLLYIDDEGNVQQADLEVLGSLIDLIYDRECTQTYWEPTWQNSQDILYVTPGICPVDLKVGIGTAAPVARLEISGVENGYQLKINGLSSAKAFAVTHNGEDKFVIKGDGSMSVGAESDPEVQFFIEPSTENSVGICLNGINSLSNHYGVKVISNDPNYKAFAINDAVSGGIDAFRIMGDGYMYATGINVLLKDDFPDYVFEKDYKLMSLYELEKYIAENKRLPNMPSAEKVSAEGLDLGEMNRLLTEKIEELTLYMIQVNKKLDEVIIENSELKELIENK